MAYGRISKKQQEILDYIKNEILNRGFPPAVREICEAVNLKSTSSVHSHLEALEKNGYIRRDATKPVSYTHLTVPEKFCDSLAYLRILMKNIQKNMYPLQENTENYWLVFHHGVQTALCRFRCHLQRVPEVPYHNI